MHQIYQFLIDRIHVVDHSEEKLELPAKSSNGKMDHKTPVTAERDDADDTLDALFSS